MTNSLDSIRPFLNQTKYLVKLGCKQVESSQNPAVRSQIVPLGTGTIHYSYLYRSRNGRVHTAS